MSDQNMLEISDEEGLEGTYLAGLESVDVLGVVTEQNIEGTESIKVEAIEDAGGKKGRKKSGMRILRSKYWDHFDKVAGDRVHVKCKYCGAAISAIVKSGTSGMKNHLDRCRKYGPNIDIKQKCIEFESKSIVDKDGGVQVMNIPKLWHFSQEDARKGLARMIILDELPFRFVDREGFRAFCKLLNPAFVVPSRTTITRDCYCLFIDERKQLKSYLTNLSSRVSLTTDTWTSGQNLSYMCLTVHFIDADWNLHKKILNFCPIVGHSGELIGKAVEKCLVEWDIKRVMTVTVDNASSNDLAIQYLRRRFNHWGGSVLDNRFLHMRCAAHILNLVVKDGLKDLHTSIVKVRGAVRYVRSSPSRLLKFKSCVLEESIECQGLVCLDVDTRWNSTYLMLSCAIKFKKAFDNLQSQGGPYVRELQKVGGAPDDLDWEKIRVFLPFLHIFYDTTLKLSGSRYVTGNFYVPQICGVGDMITTYCESEDISVRKMAYQMKVKLEKYWGNIENVNILLFIAFVLDPRQKLHYAEFVIHNFYEEEKAEMLCSKVKVSLRSLFDAYDASASRPTKPVEVDPNLSQSTQGDNQVLDVQQRLKLKYKMKMGTVETARKNELDKYLADECYPDDDGFEVLQWWRGNQKRYPILATIARDVLAMPVTSVASESAFSTGGRVLDSFRTSLSPRMVEALVLGQDWMRTAGTPIKVEECILELEEMEKGMSNMTLEQPLIIIDETGSYVD